jgi:hypothetical protein
MERHDFYFSAREATGAPWWPFGSVREWQTLEGDLLWCTEVTAPGEPPISRSPDLLLIRANAAAEFLCSLRTRQGRLWDQLNPPQAKKA